MYDLLGVLPLCISKMWKTYWGSPSRKLSQQKPASRSPWLHFWSCRMVNLAPFRAKCFHAEFISLAIAGMSTRTSDLLKECDTARKWGLELQEELRAVSAEVLMTRYHCSTKDRSLCDTLQPIGFDVGFSVENVSFCTGCFVFVLN